MTTFSKQILTVNLHEVSEELHAKAVTLDAIAEKEPIGMVRMDIEGYEYHILGNRLPDSVKMISVELHVIPPYDKSQALELLGGLREQNFRVRVAINEMIYAYYPIIQHAGLKTAYKLVTEFNYFSRYCPCVRVNPSTEELEYMIPQQGQIHLILQR
jgi:hypothetical protein